MAHLYLFAIFTVASLEENVRLLHRYGAKLKLNWKKTF